MGKERSLTPDEYLKTLIVVAATVAGDTRLRVSNIPSKIFFLRRFYLCNEVGRWVGYKIK